MKKNKLTTAVVASIAGVAGIASVSNAVHVNNEGVGEALIYPFYSVQNGLQTLISVVNTTEGVKSVKVRFLESDTSLEVLDFNLYLSPYDVWTAAIMPMQSTDPGHSGEPSGAVLTNDTSCATGFTPGSPVEFLPYIIDADLAAGNKSMARATNGYIEMIDMGTVVHPQLAAAATHPNTNCTAINDAWQGGGVWRTGNNNGIDPVFGGLFGGGAVVDAVNGFAVGYEAIALQDFWGQVTAGQQTHPGDLLPSLASAFPASTVVASNQVFTTALWSQGYEAVSALFMRDQIYNEYMVEDVVLGKSEWVLTFPTKRFHVSPGAASIAPFNNVWNGTESCEQYEFSIWDREENTIADAGSLISPVKPGGVVTFCQEVNVLQFLKAGATAPPVSDVLGGVNLTTAKTENFEAGWAQISFSQSTQALTPPAGATGPGYRGLPVVGFAVQRYTNQNAQPGLLAQYGVLFDHRGRITSI